MISKKNLRFGFAIGALSLASCAYWAKTSPSSREVQSVPSAVSAFNSDPLKWVNDMQKNVEATDRIDSYCLSMIPQETLLLSELDFDTLDKSKVESTGPEWLKKSFLLKRTLNLQLPNVSPDCRKLLVSFFRDLRQVENYVGELAYKQKDRNASDIDFKKVQPPILNEKAYSPYQTMPEFRNENGFQFAAGDVVITRGISFNSAAISQSTDDRTHFSHGVFVHKNAGSPKIQTIESYLQTGTRYYSIEEALKNENTRMAVFRPRDRELGQKASDVMAKKLDDANKAKKGIPYDYAMNLDEHSKMTCAEIILASYEWATDGSLKIPEMKSNVRLTKPYILKKFNVKPGPTFSPINMETDSRFELVMEWRDYSLMRDERQKSMVMRKLIEWMQDKDYVLQGSMTTVAIRAAWKMRNSPRIWGLISKPLSLDNIQADMPAEFLVTFAQLRDAGETLLKFTKAADLDFQKKHGVPMSEKRLLAYLEKLREDDQYYFNHGESNKFHRLIRDN